MALFNKANTTAAKLELDKDMYELERLTFCLGPDAHVQVCSTRLIA